MRRGRAMAFIIAIAQRKGGAGKTTLACQLAAAFAAEGRRVCGFDLDEQGSFLSWGKRRAIRNDVAPVEVRSVGKFGLSTALWGARDEADIVILDTPPSVDLIVRQAVRAADLAATPLQLSQLDLDAVMPTAALIGEEGKTPYFIINRAPPRARIADLIRAEIRKHNLPLAAAELGNRAAFSESLASGRGVVESAPSSPAAAEIRALAAEIAEQHQLQAAA